MILQENFTMNNGVSIPKLGLGTWFIRDGEVEAAVKSAIALGYRHIDTAQAYGNESGVGSGIKNSGVPRKELFVTTKLAAEAKSHRAAKAGIERSLKTLGLDYIDLMIIHSPQPWMKFGGANRFLEGNRDAWRALEQAQKEGKIRAIGVSNFNKEDLTNILSNSQVKPAVNQILAHVSNTPEDLIQFCQEQSILVEAYSPIGHGELMKNPNIASIAARYQVSVPQLCIRYTLQLGLLPLPKTANPAHMKSNAQVDFIISDADMTTLRTMERIEDYGDASMMPVYGGKLDFKTMLAMAFQKRSPRAFL